MRPASLPFYVVSVKNCGSNTKSLGVAAYFVERNESVVNVEGGIFQAFGHYGSRNLLEPQRKANQLSSIVWLKVFKVMKQQDVSNEVENCLGRSRIPTSCLSDGHLNVGSILLRHRLLFDNVGAIHGQAGNDLSNSMSQAVEGKVPIASILF